MATTRFMTTVLSYDARFSTLLKLAPAASIALALFGAAGCGGQNDGTGAVSGDILVVPRPGPPPYCIHTLNDPHNCGACGHDCQGGACLLNACQPVVLASNVCPTSIALDSSNVYFTSSSGQLWALRKVAKSGGLAPTDLASGPGPAVNYGAQRAADGVAVWNGTVYWVEWEGSSSQVQSISTAGGAITTLATYGNNLARMVTRTLAANATGVYWANEDNGVIRFSSAGAESIASDVFLWNGRGGLPYPVTLAVDSNYVFFTSNDPPTLPLNLLNRVPINGGSITTVGAVGAVQTSVPLSDTAIATDGINAYWASSHEAPGMILGVPVGGGAETVAALTVDPHTIVTSLAVDAQGVYWTENSASGAVAGKPFNAAFEKSYMTGQSYPFAIAVDDHAIYWINAGTSYSTFPTPLPSSCTGSVMKLAK